MQLDKPTLDAVERAYCQDSLAAFVERAWPHLEPGVPYIHNWHIDAICEHLEAVTRGEITRLLINVPPGTSKSTLTAVYWPAWVWGPVGRQNFKAIGASHEMGLATRDARRMRLLVTSDWYQDLWPVNLSGDQSQKTYFENEQRGFRQASAMTSLTGRRGDVVIIDDPHSIAGGQSEAHRAAVVEAFRETVPTRLSDPRNSAIVVIMQRVHEGDVSGEILAGDYGYEHLMLPMEFERDRKCVTSIGFEDPRTEEGELLFPERFPAEVVERDKKVMGDYASAGQLQQRPAPREGALFEWQKADVVDVPPETMRQVIRYWDKAGTKDGGAYTAGVKMGVDSDGLFYVLDVVRGQWAAPERERVIKTTASLDGQTTRIWIEQEPGSGGKESAESTIRNLAGYTIKAERPTGDKVTRADPFAVQVAAGNVRILRGPWNQDYFDEMRVFPNGKYKDQIDASSGAFNKLAVPAAVGLLLPQRLMKG